MALERVTISCTVDGQICQNVMHFKNPDGALTATQVADKIDTLWIPQWKQFQHAGAIWFDIEVRRIPTGPAVFHKTITVAGTGGAEAEQDNPVACRVMKLQTPIAGRHGHGRLYIPGTAFSAWNKGLIKPASIIAGQTVVNALKAAFVGGGATSGLQLMVAPRNAGTEADGILVTDITQRTTLGYQRRRSIGVGI